jgi:pSer/pThr/pTyr-binding forkhead associated (FHA) protein
MKIRLQKIGPTDDGMEIEIDRFPFVIGRRSESDFALPLACISRRHCQFTREGSQPLVQDLGSYNGTFVNGRRALIPLPLQHGDELSLGPIVFRVLIDPEELCDTTACVGATTPEAAMEFQPLADPSRHGPP